MKVKSIVQVLDSIAPFYYQDSWDNSGLIAGDPEMEISGILISLDATAEVIREAITRGCNLIVAHHPLMFHGTKKLTPANPEYPVIREALRQDIAIVAMHTNLDNQLNGINFVLARELGIGDLCVLRIQQGNLKKLVTFVPVQHASVVRNALFSAGAGSIGNYDSCSFSVTGRGTFRGSSETNPFVGTQNVVHVEEEERLEVVFPVHLERTVVQQLLAHHPYEEVAFDIFRMENTWSQTGTGLIGTTAKPMKKDVFLRNVKARFRLDTLRISRKRINTISVVAICSGSGTSLIPDAIAAGADIFLTGDLTYHTFQSEGRQLLLADIGHFESEQVVKRLLYSILKEKFPTFAVLISMRERNPIIYL